jgi:DNA (cytosine-5)-methyltransferase 3A
VSDEGLSLFDGISCGMVAMERAGIPVEEYSAFEIDKFASGISQKNYPGIKRFGDVFDGNFKDFKGYDVLLGGSPCTYWSIAKNNREISPDGKGGELFMQYIRALEDSGCKYFLYENNNSIHKDIKDFISKKLGVQPIMINSALVSAQHRKRCYWTNIPDITQPENKGILVRNILVSDADSYECPVITSHYRDVIEKLNPDKSYCLCARDYKGFGKQSMNGVLTPIRIGTYGNGGQGQRIYSVYGKSIALSANGGGQGARTGLYKVDLPDGEYIIRRLSPVEAERLQTLPDNYTAGFSDSQRYKCLGNGWTVDVIAHILRGIQ